MKPPLTLQNIEYLSAGICPDCHHAEWMFVTLEGFNFTCCKCESKFRLTHDLHGRLVTSRME